MQGGRGGRHPFFDFGDPFTGFGPFGDFGNFGSRRSPLSNFFGARDPFDDPFFNRPFGGMFESSLFGPSGNPFPDMHPSVFLEHQPQDPRKSRGPIIEELNSDDETEDVRKKENPRKHGRSSNEPHIEDPDDEVEEKKTKHLQFRNGYNRFNETGSQPQAHSFCFQSSTVSYGGANGTYYTSSRTRRTGSDGVTFEESKEADSATKQATHRVSRGLHNKGHSLTRKLNSDGKVDTMQALHNLDEDELAGFEESWKGKAPKYLPGWTGNVGATSSGQAEPARQGGWALPSTELNMGIMPDVRDKVSSSSTQVRTRTPVSGRGAYHPQKMGRN